MRSVPKHHSMRKIFLLITAAVSTAGACAQDMRVGTGAEVAISSGTEFYFSRQTLTPTTDFIINTSLQKDTVAANSFNVPYISRTYRFLGTAPVFSGSVGVTYLDGELNGVDETTLQTIIYNGSAWHAAGGTISSSSGNYVLTSGLNAQPLGELVIVASNPLPMQWEEASASRKGLFVLIRWSTLQEANIDHFDVERSIDAGHWITVIGHIPAGNRSIRTDYAQTDQPACSGQLYYRIRRTDKDGHIAFSKIISVAAEHNAAPVAISPNPVRDHFTISGIAPATISRVDLLNASGYTAASWSGQEVQFEVSQLPAGPYYLCIRMANGEIISRPLSVQ